MPTFLNEGCVFGPVLSRRLGLSLGVNLNASDGKRCTFDCLYCENGLNEQRRTTTPLPTCAQIGAALEARLSEMAGEGRLPDVITLAGNGEPTLNPEFCEVVDVACALRDRFAPSSRIAVLSNATMADRPRVHAALERVDDNILKLDTVDAAYVRLLDRPQVPYDVGRVVETLASFHGHVIVQTIFVTGSVGGVDLDNTKERYVASWLEALRRIGPEAVTVYTVARDVPVAGVEKAPREAIDAICARVRALGIACTAAY